MSLRPRGKPERVDGVVLAPGASLLNQYREGGWKGEELVLTLLPWRRNGGPLQDHPLWLAMPLDGSDDDWAEVLTPGAVASFWVAKGSTGDPDGARMTAYLGPNTDEGFARAVAEWTRRRQLIDPVFGSFRHDAEHDRHSTVAGWRGARIRLILETAERGGAEATLAVARDVIEAAQHWHDRIAALLPAELGRQSEAAAGLDAEALFAHLTPRAILVRDRDDIEIQYDGDALFDHRTVIAVADAEAGCVREILLVG